MQDKSMVYKATHFYQLMKAVSVDSFFDCFSSSNTPDFYFAGEMHDFWECVFVVDGTIGVSENETIYELSKGEIIFHKPMAFHSIWATNNSSPKLIITSFTATGFALNMLSGSVFSLNESATKFMHEIAEIAETKIISEPNWKTDYISQQLLSNRLEALMLSIMENAKEIKCENTAITAQNYKRIIIAMNENLDKPLAIDDLAKLTNLSPSNLKKCFRKYSGTGVINYLNRLKMIKAESLIREGYSMNKISDMLGFSSQNYFSTSFKREFGMSPIEYKKTL